MSEIGGQNDTSKKNYKRFGTTRHKNVLFEIRSRPKTREKGQKLPKMGQKTAKKGCISVKMRKKKGSNRKGHKRATSNAFVLI